MNENSGFLYKLNCDNEFSVRFNIENESLTHIPNNIFSVELPEIAAEDMTSDEIDRTLKITLRSTTNGLVEKEMFGILFRKMFDVDISLSNPNIISWKYKSCILEKIGFSPLIGRKSRSNPFNFTLYIKVGQIVYNGDNTIIEFGNPSAYDSYTPIDEKQEGEQ